MPAGPVRGVPALPGERGLTYEKYMERSSGVDGGCMGPAMPVVCLSIPSAREDMAGGPRAVVPGTGESGAEVLLPAGLGSCTGLYVAVRGIGGGGAGAHVHIADSVAGTSIIQRRLCRSGDMWRCRQERAVKPSAQPTLVRTQHLPPPGKTARCLRKRGPAGRFLLVPPCVIVYRSRPWRSNRYGQIADSVRPEGAVRGTACFADPCPFCPVTRASGLPA